MGKKSSSPPDVTGAAKVEGKFSRETARDVTYADRPDQNNPFGSVTCRYVTPPRVKWSLSGRKIRVWPDRCKMCLIRR